jgi:hypothetical protein
LNRTIPELQDIGPESVDLAQMVAESDNEILRKGLKELGVSDEMLERMKTLDGLARTSGHFLSVSLEKTHRLDFLQLIHLHEVADGLRQKLLAKAGAPGHIADDETRSYLNRNYVELVKAGGEGYKLMMEGAQAMVRMLAAAQGDDPEDKPTGTGKPRWGRTGAKKK